MHVNPLLSEELFQHIWKCRLFKQDGLITTTGEPVQILYPGLHNHHSGPDFSAARIRIGNTLWAGQVELHLRTSDWFRHKHQDNEQYRRIILHVVFIHDMPANAAPGVPCLELQSCIPKLLLRRYEDLRRSAAFVPCAAHAGRIPRLTWLGWKERLLAERWERKVKELRTWLECNQYNWEEVCYWSLAQCYGLPVNNLSFLRLAQSLPYNTLQRYKQQPLQTEALLLGQAGMLAGTFTDVYALQLQQEYEHLRRKHQLQPMPAHQWNWLRMRPAAFPAMRIATFAALIQQEGHLFSRILETTKVSELEKMLFVQPSAYWRTHYRLGHTARNVHRPGKQFVHAVLINSVLPLLYLYGQQKKALYYQQLALHFLQQLPPEMNHITKAWTKLGVIQESAMESQALLQLKQCYCEEKKCLDCTIGIKILSGG